MNRINAANQALFEELVKQIQIQGNAAGIAVAIVDEEGKTQYEQYQIMELRFGLADGIERTQKEAADALGISQSYISRLEKRIIHTLKVQLESE